MNSVSLFLFFALGLAMIIKGSDWFLNAVVWLAEVFRVPHMIIGATIVSLCTTMPEAFVSTTASLRGETDVAFGNALGSIAVNTGVILALLLVFGRPKITNRKDFIVKGLFLFSSLLLVWFWGMSNGQITRMNGLILIGLLAVFLLSNVFSARNSPLKQSSPDKSPRVVAQNIAGFAIGIACVICGSNLLVENGTQIAQVLEVSSIVIALTMTAFGTSLPELVTTIRALSKGVYDIGVGNIIGANILNVLYVIGASAIITPIPLSHDPSILRFQFPVIFLLIGLVILFGFVNKKHFRSSNGVVLLCIYGFYLTVTILRETTPILGPLLFQ